jgi:GH25 family lysozyme M1 (1,4-beta-N-acetylmuramidase)
MRRFGRPRHPWLRATLALLLTLGVLPLAATPAFASTDYSTNCGVQLRSTADTTSTSLAVIPTGTVVTTEGVVSGGSWSATCPGSVAGTTWYSVSAVNGTSVSALYGVPLAYAASGLFSPAISLEGVDVSHYQNTISWPAVAAAGKRFAVIQATVGQTYLDPTYLANRAGARAAGVPSAAYHFAEPSSAAGDAVTQADWFAQNIGLTAGDLIPALDVEHTGGLSPADLTAWVQAWLNEATARLGVRPMIYTSPSFWKTSLANTTAFADQGYSVLWIAHWNVASPSVPANNWEGVGWTFWQYDDCGSVAGISGCTDLDRFHGLDLGPVTYTGPGANPPPVGSPPPSPPPVLASIAPSAAQAGAPGVTVTIQGANFAAGISTVAWNGTPLTTTFVSASTLTAVVPAALIAEPGTATVTVINVGNGVGGGASGAIPFQVTLPPVQLEVHPSTTVVAWGQPVTLRIDSKNLGPGRTVTLQRMQANESTWADVTTLTTDTGGSANTTYTPPVNTQFRAVATDSTGTTTGQADPERVVVRQLAVLRPTNLGRIRTVPAGSTVTFTTTVRPVGAGLAPATVTFSFWHLVGSSWVQFTHRDVHADAGGRASWTWTFSSRGQWYVRAMADPTLTNANSVMTQIERYSVT